MQHDFFVKIRYKVTLLFYKIKKNESETVRRQVSSVFLYLISSSLNNIGKSSPSFNHISARMVRRYQLDLFVILYFFKCLCTALYSVSFIIKAMLWVRFSLILCNLIFAISSFLSCFFFIFLQIILRKYKKFLTNKIFHNKRRHFGGVYPHYWCRRWRRSSRQPFRWQAGLQWIYHSWVRYEEWTYWCIWRRQPTRW